MARLRWALTCQRVLIDKETNTVSYIEAVEGMTVPELPISVPPFSVATLWEKEGDKDRLLVRFRILKPDKKKLLEFKSKNLAMKSKRHRFNLRLQDLVIEQVGTYTILVDQRRGNRWRKVATMYIDVVKTKPDRK